MAGKTLKDIAQKMRGIDIAFLSTHTEGGQIAGRPMSNNGEVEYDGDNWFYTFDQARVVSDIHADPRVALSFDGKDGFYLAVEGRAELVRDKAAFREHWTDGLDQWFQQGVDTPGLVLIKVSAERATYWDGEDSGDVTL